MPNTADDTEDLTPLAELATSLGLADGQQATLLEALRQQLATQEQRLRAALDVRHTGLGTDEGARILPLREAERRHLIAALEHTRGKIYGRDGAAKLLDLKPTTLQSKLKKHGIDRLVAAGLGSESSEAHSEADSGTTRIPSAPAVQASAPAVQASVAAMAE